MHFPGTLQIKLRGGYDPSGLGWPGGFIYKESHGRLKFYTLGIFPPVGDIQPCCLTIHSEARPLRRHRCYRPSHRPLFMHHHSRLGFSKILLNRVRKASSTIPLTFNKLSEDLLPVGFQTVSDGTVYNLPRPLLGLMATFNNPDSEQCVTWSPTLPSPHHNYL